MHTAGFAQSYQQLLAAVNHPPDKRCDTSLGNQLLLAQGKALGLATDDDLSALIARLQQVVVSTERQEAVI